MPIRTRSLGDAVSQRVVKTTCLPISPAPGALALVLAAVGVYGVLAYGGSGLLGAFSLTLLIRSRFVRRRGAGMGSLARRSNRRAPL